MVFEDLFDKDISNNAILNDLVLTSGICSEKIFITDDVYHINNENEFRDDVEILCEKIKTKGDSEIACCCSINIDTKIPNK